MRIANYGNRAVIVEGQVGAERFYYLDELSGGRFGSRCEDVFDCWDELTSWYSQRSIDESDGAKQVDMNLLGPPSPAPRQVFGVGLNYRDYVESAGIEPPVTLPPIFTKYVSSFSGPTSAVAIPPGTTVDWEIELVVIVGKSGRDILVDDAWSHVAGVTAGQDLSDRVLQNRGPSPQSGLGKSFPGFAPQGPWLVSPDEFDDPDDLGLRCVVNGATMQLSRTSQMIYSVPMIVSGLSKTVELLPGDVIFTGTPAGVGFARTPPKFLSAGDTVESWIEGIGNLRQTFV
ncbi:fumarylacetoacetate hydrolase family protein [Rhodococcoides fascians]|uniref:fumarylacetoacetate hydrolase family protein n=1 Tax=Rhodococcoides fascians TaxID=1828 RepID=UPI00050CD10F|nr:fumarylacetoacetate hydrolase family protein [Rhodococcus fascians]